MAFTKITHAGIGSTGTVLLENLEVTGVGTFGGSVSVGGTLTYEDVTNVDSVGLITARNGIVVGSGITLSKDGDIFATGITTVGKTVFLSGNNPNIRIDDSDTTNNGEITLDNTQLRIEVDEDDSTSSSAIKFRVDGSDQVTIDSSGDLTIKDKIIHSGDTNTAIRFPEADNFTVECAGNERFRVKPTNDIAVFTGSNSGSLTIRNDTSNEVQLHTGGSDALIFGTGGENERLRISSGGQVRINTAGAPSADLHVGGTDAVLNALFQTSRSSGAYHKYALGASGADLGYIGSAQQLSSSGVASGFVFRSEAHIEFCAGGSTERARIDSSGRLLHGHATSRSVGTKTGQLQVINSGNNAAISIIQTNNAASAPFLCFGKTRSANDTGSTIVQNGDSLGQILFAGADGSDVDSTAALITAKVDGTPGSNDMPGKLVFATTADGASTATPAMEISSVGIVTCRNVPSFLISIDSLTDTGNNAIIISENNGFTLSATSRNSHNFGNHFNEADGKFTAPVEGLYFFGYSIMRSSTSGSGAVDIRIMKNGGVNSLYSRNYQGSYQVNFQAEGNTTIARLKKDDYIQFRIGANMSVHNDDSYFYGYLIG